MSTLGAERQIQPEVIHVFLTDDLVAYRTAFASLLDGEYGFRVVGQGADLSEARHMLSTLSHPLDVALIGMRLPDGPGMNLIPDIHSTFPGCDCVMLRANWNKRDDTLAVAAGAAALFPRTATMDEIAFGIRELRTGKILIPPEERIDQLQKALAYQAEQHAAVSALSRLTPRESDILHSLAHGKSDKDTADEWGVSRKTVAAHMANLLEKLGVESRLQAVLLALRYEVVDLD